MTSSFCGTFRTLSVWIALEQRKSLPISVLSATEGLSVAAPWLAPFTVPLTVMILVGGTALCPKSLDWDQ